MQGKTFLIAVFACFRCILYPNTKICISSKTRSQAAAVLEKIITELMPNSDNLKLEIDDYSLNPTNAYISFKNASRIKIVSANDNARSGRANILISQIV